MDRPHRPPGAPAGSRPDPGRGRRAGAGLDDLKLIAQAAYEAWRELEPDPDEDPRGKGFGDRYLQLDTTMDRGRAPAGDLTPECAAAVTAVLESLGKRRGPEDLRSAWQRYHDALQEACELLIGAKMVPDRGGADTRVNIHIGLRDLLDMDGASVIEDTWLRARAGEHGYLSGRGSRGGRLRRPHRPGRHRQPRLDRHRTDDHPDHRRLRPPAPGPAGPATGSRARTAPASRRPGQDGPPRHADPHQGPQPRPLPPEAWEALQYALAKLAIRLRLRPRRPRLRAAPQPPRRPLQRQERPSSTSATPTRSREYIRKAVIARDKGCAWPGGCNRRPAQ